MRVIVLGCGRVGAGVARILDGEGHAVTVIDRDPASFQRLGPVFRGQTIEGIAFDRSTLEKAGVDHADALAAVTGSDEANAIAARAVSTHFGVPRVVARMFDPRQADLYRRLGVMTISPVSWGIGRVVDLITVADMAITASLGAGQVDVVEAVVGHRLHRRPVSELEVPGEARVVAVTRGGRTWLPDSRQEMEGGDVVHVAVAHTALERLQTLLRGE